MKSLRTFTDPFFKMTTSLDGSDYVLEFRHNQREDAWYFSISLPDGTLLASGIKIVCNWPLLRKFIDSRLPPGELVAIPNTQDTSPGGLIALGEGSRVTLYYVPEEDLA